MTETSGEGASLLTTLARRKLFGASFSGRALALIDLLCLGSEIPEHAVGEDGKMQVGRNGEVCEYCGRGECRRVDRIGRRPLFRSSLCPRSVIKQQRILKRLVIYEKRQWDEYYTTNVCVESKKALFNAYAGLICRTIIGSYLFVCCFDSQQPFSR